MSGRTGNPRVKKVAQERIAVLFAQAARFLPSDPEVSRRLVCRARRIAMRQRVRIDREYRRQFCHHCSAFLLAGVTARVRVQRGRVVITCLSCRRHTRIPVGRSCRRKGRPGQAFKNAGQQCG